LYNPLVSIIVLNYNGKNFLKKCLPSVLETRYPNLEIIVVDNGSIDGSLEFLSGFSFDCRIRVIKNRINKGYAAGNNIGICSSHGDYLVFLNNDTVVEPEWLSELIKAMESDLSIGAAQSKLLLMDSPKHLDCAGNFSDFYGGTLSRGLGEEDVDQYKYGEIFSCKGAAMIIRRGVLDKIGLFDSDYFAYYEDTDLCWRIQLAGYKILYIPSSIVYHKGSGSIPTVGDSSTFFQVYLMKRNRIALLLKNYEIKNAIRYLISVLVYETSKIAIVGLNDLQKHRNLSYSIASSKAILWNLKHFRQTWNKRVYVQKVVRSISDREIISKMQHSNQS